MVKFVKLADLKVQELRNELDERSLSTSGKKIELQERLRQALESEGEDPETYMFSMEGNAFDITELSKQMKEMSEQMATKISENQKEVSKKIEQSSGKLQMEFSKQLEQSSGMLQMEFSKQLEQSSGMLQMEFSKQIEHSSKQIEKISETQTDIFGKIETISTNVREQIEILEAEVDQKIIDATSEMVEKIDDVKDKVDAIQSRVSKLELGSSMAPSSSGQRLKPPKFEGDLPWSTFIRQFEIAANANGWSKNDRAAALMLSLRGPALSALQSVPSDAQNNYDLLVENLTMRFGDSHMKQLHTIQLKSCVQKHGQSLQDFELDVERLTRLAYGDLPEELFNRLTIQAFIDGLQDREMEQALRMCTFSKIPEVLTRALEFEAAKRACKNIVRVREVKSADEESLREMVKKIIGEEEKAKEKPRITCWNCGKPGHVRTNCRNRKRARTEKEDSQPKRILPVRRTVVLQDEWNAANIQQDQRKEREDTEKGYPQELDSRFQNTHDYERVNINMASDRMKTQYDRRANAAGFEEGNLVWLNNLKQKLGLCSKLQPAWEGPYKVIKRINGAEYRIQKPPRGKLKVVHIDRLASYEKPVRDEQI